MPTKREALIEAVRTAYTEGTPQAFVKSILTLSDPATLAMITTVDGEGETITLMEAALKYVGDDADIIQKNKTLFAALGPHMIGNDSRGNPLKSAVENGNLLMVEFLFPYYMKNPSELKNFWGDQKAGYIQTFIIQAINSIKDNLVEADKAYALLKYFKEQLTSNPEASLSSSMVGFRSDLQNAVYLKGRDLFPHDIQFMRNSSGRLSPMLTNSKEISRTNSLNNIPLSNSNNGDFSMKNAETLPLGLYAGVLENGLTLRTACEKNDIDAVKDFLKSENPVASEEDVITAIGLIGENVTKQKISDLLKSVQILEKMKGCVTSGNTSTILPLIEKQDKLVRTKLAEAILLDAFRCSDLTRVRKIFPEKAYEKLPANSKALAQAIKEIGQDSDKSSAAIKQSIAILEHMLSLARPPMLLELKNNEIVAAQLNAKLPVLRTELLNALENDVRAGILAGNCENQVEALKYYFFGDPNEDKNAFHGDGYERSLQDFQNSLAKLGLDADGKPINIVVAPVVKNEINEDAYLKKLAIAEGVEDAKVYVGAVFVDPDSRSRDFQDAHNDLTSVEAKWFHKQGLKIDVVSRLHKKNLLSIKVDLVVQEETKKVSLLEYACIKGLNGVQGSAANPEGVSAEVFTFLVSLLDKSDCERVFKEIIQSKTAIHPSMLRTVAHYAGSENIVVSNNDGSSSSSSSSNVVVDENKTTDEGALIKAIEDAFKNVSTTLETMQQHIHALKQFELKRFEKESDSDADMYAESCVAFELDKLQLVKRVAEIGLPVNSKVFEYVLDALLKAGYYATAADRLTLYQSFAAYSDVQAAVFCSFAKYPLASVAPPGTLRNKEKTDIGVTLSLEQINENIRLTFKSSNSTPEEFVATVSGFRLLVEQDIRPKNFGEAISGDDIKEEVGKRLLLIQVQNENESVSLLQYACEKGLASESNTNGVNPGVFKSFLNLFTMEQIRAQLAQIPEEKRDDSVKPYLVKYALTPTHLTPAWKKGAAWGAGMALVAIAGILIDAYLCHDTKMHEKLCSVADWCWQDKHALGHDSDHGISAQHTGGMLTCVGAVMVMAGAFIGAVGGAAVGGPKKPAAANAG